ncbi:MAG: Mut7-C RNAse domain-containing protein [candidate division WOR-3 bacterium]
MKFICNGMLGKLCKYLRICGIDTLYSNEGMKSLILARKENRIFLTRNLKLKEKEGVFFVESEFLSNQLRIVIKHFNLADQLHFFSRCLRCNELLINVLKEDIKNFIPFYTYKNFNEFARCPKCQRIYWKGSHYEKMIQIINNLIG